MYEALIGGAMSLLDKVVPDFDERRRLANELATLAERQAHEIAKLQIGVNTEDSKSNRWFQAGWRPFIGWTCGFAICNNYLVVPYVSAFSKVAVPTLDLSELLPILGGLLGLGIYRTYEKVKGVAK